jgi:hypothetical protein
MWKFVGIWPDSGEFIGEMCWVFPRLAWKNAFETATIPVAGSYTGCLAKIFMGLIILRCLLWLKKNIQTLKPTTNSRDVLELL